MSVVFCNRGVDLTMEEAETYANAVHGKCKVRMGGGRGSGRRQG